MELHRRPSRPDFSSRPSCRFCSTTAAKCAWYCFSEVLMASIWRAKSCFPTATTFSRSVPISATTELLISIWLSAFFGSLRSRKSFSARRPSNNLTSILLFNSKIVRALSAASRYTAVADSPYICMPPTRMTPATPTMPIAVILCASRREKPFRNDIVLVLANSSLNWRDQNRHNRRKFRFVKNAAGALTQTIRLMPFVSVNYSLVGILGLGGIGLQHDARRIADWSCGESLSTRRTSSAAFLTPTKEVDAPKVCFGSFFQCRLWVGLSMSIQRRLRWGH